MKKSNSLLTIVVPTANRQDYLPQTITNLVYETKHSQQLVPIIIADNANEVAITLELLGLENFTENVSIFRFHDRVGIEESIVRSSLIAETPYVWIFGDDDLIIEGCFTQIYKTLVENKPDYLYLNRYIISHNLKNIEGTEHNVELPTIASNITGKEAIVKFHHHAGFITSLITKTGLFKDYEPDFKNRFSGFSFLASLYMKTLNGKISYISHPVLFQRRSKSLWKKLWFKYWLVSIPSLFLLLDEKGVDGSYQAVMKDVNRTAIYTSIVAKASGVRSDDNVWNDALQYQVKVNKWGITIVRYMLTEKLAKYILNIKDLILKR